MVKLPKTGAVLLSGDITKEKAQIWINHDKDQRDGQRLSPAFYESEAVCAFAGKMQAALMLKIKTLQTNHPATSAYKPQTAPIAATPATTAG